MDEDESKQQPKILGDIIIAGASAIMGAFTQTTPIGIGLNFIQFSYLQNNQKKFEQDIRNELEKLGQQTDKKIDQDALASDEFQSVLIQVVEVAVKTASNLKRQALARLLVNSAICRENEIASEETAIRLIEKMSNEEMLSLSAIYSFLATNKSLEGASHTEIMQRLEWDRKKVCVACEGLLQLGLLFESPLGTKGFINRNEPINVRQYSGWFISELGYYLIHWCQEQQSL